MDKQKLFWSRVDKDSNTHGCWEWKLSVGAKGYAMMRFGGKKELVHRLSWFFHTGKWPKLFVLHSCDNRKCVNPAHLREGTHADNTADMVLRNRQAKGEAKPLAKLDTATVVRIFQMRSAGASQQEIADRVGLTLSPINQVLNRKTWRHVEIPPTPESAKPPRRGIKPNEEYASAVIQMSEKGYRQIAIAEQMGVSRQAISALLIRHRNR